MPIPFFRRIRKKMAEENRPTKYLRYAIGEIVLVVIGILIALQINNWNEERKRKEIFLATVEQIYNLLELETQDMRSSIDNLTIQQNFLGSLYNNEDSLTLKKIPGLLFYVETEPMPFNTTVNFQLQNLKINPKDRSENRLARNLNNYIAKANFDFSKTEKPISAMLIEQGLPVPTVNFGASLFIQPEVFTSYFNPQEQQKAKDLLTDPALKQNLVQLAQRKEYEKILIGENLGLAQNTLNQIKRNYPGVRLLYENLGFVGDGTAYQDWGTDVPLQLTDEDRSIWEGTLTLKGGKIKLRENKSWSINWGGKTFPKGNLEWFGQEIPSLPGEYRVVVNLTDKTYEFIPLNP